MRGETLYEILSQIESKKGPHIDVGRNLHEVGIMEDFAVYVANSGSDTVSVISAGNNTKVAYIPVGKRPVARSWWWKFRYHIRSQF